jgi:uncharacterized protein (TIGR00290 family)
MKVAVSWSGGKESCLALHKAILDGLQVSNLLTFVSFEGHCMSHGLHCSLISAQSQAIEIPLIQWITGWKTYGLEFISALSEMKKSGIQGIVFGDIHDIPNHEGWVDRVCKELQLVPIKPLWGQDPHKVIRDIIDLGFETTVISADSNILGEDWLGRKIDCKFVNDLQSFKQRVNPCGEYGEYHTYVINGPLFKRKIKILDYEKKLKDGRWLLDITKYEILSKKDT